MTPKKHLIALIGFGNVAKGLIHILHRKQKQLHADHGFDFEIVAVSTRSRGTMYDPSGLPLSLLLALSESTTPFDSYLKDWGAEDLIRNSNATIVVEMTHTNIDTGEPALSHCQTALETGIHVVCANKGPATLAYDALKQMAKKNNKLFLNEATVMSGTPVINYAKNALAGNSILRIRGILNGATNFILSEMETGTNYEQALEMAERAGYLEADHTADIGGFDAQAKLVILANAVMGISLHLDNVKRSGISQLTSNDILDAKARNERWKLIASIEVGGDEIYAEVKPERVSMDDPLAHILGTTNSITFSTDILGDVSISGPGAGREETGYGILSDLLIINRGDRA